MAGYGGFVNRSSKPKMLKQVNAPKRSKLQNRLQRAARPAGRKLTQKSGGRGLRAAMHSPLRAVGPVGLK